MERLFEAFSFDLSLEAGPDFVVLHTHVALQDAVSFILRIRQRTSINPIPIKLLLYLILLRSTIAIRI